ncbi:inactive dipeptidyl peptidase 10-like isoform X2 [Artemia franciscana]|uniref:inactive dipeptidyl peptidase 10-like isoform X2 n=1 Tax=Artemia franciscana TaxID=6661 RepID=UPI0032DBC409
MPAKGNMQTGLSESQELVNSSPSERNWRGIFIALLVIVSVCSLIVTAVVLMTPPDDGPRVRGRRLSMEDVMTDHLQAKPLNLTWISDFEIAYIGEHGSIEAMDVRTLQTKALMSNATSRHLKADFFRISADRRFILLGYDIIKVSSYSFEARYRTFDVETEQIIPVTPDGNNDADGFAATGDGPRLSLAMWSPTGHGLVIVYHNDIFYKANSTSEVLRITSSGRIGIVFNGIPDYMYEEHILKSREACWFSPDGNKLLYATFDNTDVGGTQYTWFGGIVPGSEVRFLKYPRAGLKNPVATLNMVDLREISAVKPIDGIVRVRSKEIKPPLLIRDQEHYFTSVTMYDSNTVSIVWLDRLQQMIVPTVCRGGMWYCQPIHTERALNGGWVNLKNPPMFSRDGSHLLVLLPLNEGSEGRFTHVCIITVTRNRLAALTSGMFDVIEIVSWDETNHVIYFVAAPENRPMERHLYKVTDPNSTEPRVVSCLTCPENRLENQKECQWNRVLMSPGQQSFYIQECLGPEFPSVYIRSTSENDAMILFDDYSLQRTYLAELAFPKIKHLEVDLQNGYTGHVKLKFPPGLHEDEIIKRPLLIYISCPPGSQAVTSKWSIDWTDRLVTSLGIIVAVADFRGSSNEGERRLMTDKSRLGLKEAEDALTIIRYLKENLEYVDREKIVVLGQEYGGHIATMLLSIDPEAANCLALVAPLANPKHYVSYFSERYLGMPNSSSANRRYDEVDTTKKIANIEGVNSILLAHGTSGLTPNSLQGMILAQALISQGILFQHQVYPDETETFERSKKHLYSTLEKFISACLSPIDDTVEDLILPGAF